MPEMPGASKGHRQTARIGRRNHLGILHRAAGLNCRRGAGFGGGNQTIREREKGVAAHHAARQR